MDCKQIKELASILEKASLTYLEYEQDGHRVVMKKEVPAPQVQPMVSQNAPTVVNVTEEKTVPPSFTGTVVHAPVVGTLYTAKEPGQPPFVTAGQSVKKGDVLCLIEAMKMFSEINAPCDGTVTSILIENGQLAEYNMPLFEIEE